MEGRERKFSLSSQPEPLHTPHPSFSTPMQQHQSHEMVALKKAYADVILNTMKESAGRVMVSEKRALMLQQELNATKENALLMLMRLKKMMDAKTAEAEKASLQKQRKIEELEAQLNEAEDVVTDLRAELKHVYLVLEKIRNNQAQPLNGKNIKQVATCLSVKPETSISSPHKELECITSCDVVNKSLTMNILEKKCCNSKQQTEQLHISNLEDSSGHDSDFASVITRSKEPELCRNGFTQRIRALEGNLLDEKLLMQDVHNQHYGKELGVIAKGVDGKVVKYSALTEEMKIHKHLKLLKIPKWKIFFYRSRFLSCKLSKDVCSLPSINLSAIIKWKRKRRRHRNLGIKPSAFRSCKPSFVLEQCSSVCDNAKCCEDENDANMRSVPLLTDAEATELVEKAIEKDNKLSNTGERAEQNLTGPSSDMKVEVVVDVSSTNTDMKDENAFIEKDRSCSQVEESKPLKYTFQRKRKKESLGNTDQNFDDSKKSTVKRRVEDKQNGAWEPQNV